MAKDPIAVLGTGMAAFGASNVLALSTMPFLLFDKNNYYGGHTRSLCYQNGFLFDEGGHISFTKNAHVRQLLADNVNGDYEERRLGIDNYWNGYRITHPVQSNLRGLPPELICKVIADFVAVRHGVDRIATLQSPDVSRQESSTYADWLYAMYGTKFAETFPMVYGEKYHTTSMDKLTTDWIGPRMHKPSLEELVYGALESRTSTTHYVDVYRYPTKGGFVGYIESFARKCDLRLNHELASIAPQDKELRFTNQTVHRYSAVISSIPLPALVPRIEGVPQDVLDASRRLAFTTAVLVNIGIDRSDVSDTAITYFYDPDVICSRVNLPHMFSNNNVPPGCGSIQAEIYFSQKYKPIDAPLEVLARRAVADLTRCGFVRPDDKILMLDTMVNEYANVIYDFDRPAALRIVHDFLKDVGIIWCGRYGQWNHDWTDQAFLDGERAAEEALAKLE